MLEHEDGDWNSQFPIVHLHHTPFPQTQGFVEEEAGRAQEAMDEHKDLTILQTDVQHSCTYELIVYTRTV